MQPPKKGSLPPLTHSKKIFRRKEKQKTKFFSSGGEKNLFCPEKRVYLHPQASMVELVDTHVSGTCAARCAGSSPVRGTTTTPAFKNAGVFLSPRFFRCAQKPAGIFSGDAETSRASRHGRKRPGRPSIPRRRNLIRSRKPRAKDSFYFPAQQGWRVS